MPVEINGQKYSTSVEVSEELNINPVTLWRWRKKGLIPPGLRSRNRQVLFTAQEVAEIREYSTKLVPVELGAARQLGLFSRNREEAQ